MIKAVLGFGELDDDAAEKAWDLYIEQANAMVDHFKSQPAVGEKPKEGDTSVVYYDIPDSDNLSIRLWDGNMQQNGAYCFDFYDTSKRTAVNLPLGYKICNVPRTGAFVVGGMGSELKNMEFAWGFTPETIPPGQERFAAPEGSGLALVRPGKPPYFFELPMRPRTVGGVGAIFAQPRR